MRLSPLLRNKTKRQRSQCRPRRPPTLLPRRPRIATNVWKIESVCLGLPYGQHSPHSSGLDELESLLREKSTSAVSPSESGDKVPVSTPSSTIDDFGFLPPTNGAALDGTTVNLSPYFPTPNDASLGGLDYAFTDGTSLDQLAGIASLIGHSPQENHNGNVSTPSSDSQSGMSQSGMASSTPPTDASMSMLYLSWPATLPDIVTTRHLYVAPLCPSWRLLTTP